MNKIRAILNNIPEKLELIFRNSIPYISNLLNYINSSKNQKLKVLYLVFIMFTGLYLGLNYVHETPPMMLEGSDKVTDVLMFRDIFQNGYGLDGWALPVAPNFFPELGIYFLLYSLIQNPLLVNHLIAFVFLSIFYLISISLIRIVRTKSAYKPIIIFTLALTPGMLWGISNYWVLNRVPLFFFFISYHTGAFLIAMSCLPLLIKTSVRNSYKWMSVVLFLTIITILSDRLFITYFTIPSILTISSLFLFYRDKKIVFHSMYIYLTILVMTMGLVLIELPILDIIPSPLSRGLVIQRIIQNRLLLSFVFIIVPLALYFINKYKGNVLDMLEKIRQYPTEKLKTNKRNLYLIIPILLCIGIFYLFTSLGNTLEIKTISDILNINIREILTSSNIGSFIYTLKYKGGQFIAISYLLILFISLRKLLTKSILTHSEKIFYLFSFWFAISMIPITIIVTDYKLIFEIRYIAFLPLYLVILISLSINWTKRLFIFSVLLLVFFSGYFGLKLINKTDHFNSISDIASYRPDFVECLDKNKSEYGLETGISDSFVVKLVNAFSQEGNWVNIVSGDKLKPGMVYSNINWYFETENINKLRNHNYVMLSDRPDDNNPRKDTMLELFGDFSQEFECPNYKIYVYEGSGINDYLLDKLNKNSLIKREIYI